jgi:hypothetical protein
MSLISAGSISLDSTFKSLNTLWNRPFLFVVTPPSSRRTNAQKISSELYMQHKDKNCLLPDTEIILFAFNTSVENSFVSFVKVMTSKTKKTHLHYAVQCTVTVWFSHGRSVAVVVYPDPHFAWISIILLDPVLHTAVDIKSRKRKSENDNGLILDLKKILCIYSANLTVLCVFILRKWRTRSPD